ncbi:DUF2000 domain-containing protein [Biostraticola tofi]|uniref:DUF2000 family protein n=1 Tax=Biostraticola tofi TaxID=466109 RepID=A0A4V2W4B4_9GAMM|nr:DUF2000 domain-containing protein [Biostraticola tofi]TCV95269.1 hypothetical protein EDC52_106201 [Biostraticola tofi]
MTTEAETQQAVMTESESQPALPRMRITVVLREDLEPWQRLNVTAFTISGVAINEEALGETYHDASGKQYLPMFRDPVLVFGASAETIKRTAERARSRGVAFSVFTRELFDTFNDDDNRAAVAAVATEDLDIVGLAFRAGRNTADKVLKGLKLLQ